MDQCLGNSFKVVFFLLLRGFGADVDEDPFEEFRGKRVFNLVSHAAALDSEKELSDLLPEC